MLDALLKIPGNFHVVTEWQPVPADKARKEVNKRRRHFNISKTGFISQLGNDPAKTNPRDVLVDESKQSDIENLGDCLRALGDGQSLGEFSLTIVLYSRDSRELERLIGEFTGVFTNADGALFVETYNQLNAYFATVPGNSVFNLRRLLLLNTNYADLSFLFTILPGDKRNQHLGAEYLAVLETDNHTPYFLNLHNGEVAHTLILGMTGSGKSYLCCFLLQNAQKYRPFTFIFDIGGSFQSLTTIFGGSYLNVGRESRDFTINPFSLPRTEENLQFLFAFFRTLIEGNEQRYRLDFKEERKLWDGIERVYMLEPGTAYPLELRQYRWRAQGPAASLDPPGTIRIPLRQRGRHTLVQPVSDVQLCWLGRRAGSSGAAPLLCPAQSEQRDHRQRDPRDIQSISARRGVAVHSQRDDSQVCGAGAEDLAQTQCRDDPRDSIHQGA